MITFMRDAEEKKLLTFESTKKIEEFRKKLTPEIDEEFYELIQLIREEFFKLGELSRK